MTAQASATGPRRKGRMSARRWRGSPRRGASPPPSTPRARHAPHRRAAETQAFGSESPERERGPHIMTIGLNPGDGLLRPRQVQTALTEHQDEQGGGDVNHRNRSFACVSGPLPSPAKHHLRHDDPGVAAVLAVFAFLDRADEAVLELDRGLALFDLRHADQLPVDLSR